MVLLYVLIYHVNFVCTSCCLYSRYCWSFFLKLESAKHLILFSWLAPIRPCGYGSPEGTTGLNRRREKADVKGETGRILVGLCLKQNGIFLPKYESFAPSSRGGEFVPSFLYI